MVSVMLWEIRTCFILTGRQVADCVQAVPLLQKLHFQALLADKGYDTDAILTYVESVGAKAIIPPKSNRIVQREYDLHFYKERYSHRVQFWIPQALPPNLFSIRQNCFSIPCFPSLCCSSSMAQINFTTEPNTVYYL